MITSEELQAIIDQHGLASRYSIGAGYILVDGEQQPYVREYDTRGVCTGQLRAAEFVELDFDSNDKHEISQTNQQ